MSYTLKDVNALPLQPKSHSKTAAGLQGGRGVEENLVDLSLWPHGRRTAFEKGALTGTGAVASSDLCGTP